MARINIVQAINMALMQELKRDKNVVVMGEDVGVNGGVFRATDNLHKKYGISLESMEIFKKFHGHCNLN